MIKNKQKGVTQQVTPFFVVKFYVRLFILFAYLRHICDTT